MIGGKFNGHITKLVLHMPHGDIEMPVTNIRAVPGMWSLQGPQGFMVQHFWRFAPPEPGGAEIWYGGPWSAEFAESSIEVVGPGSVRQ